MLCHLKTVDLNPLTLGKGKKKIRNKLSKDVSILHLSPNERDEYFKGYYCRNYVVRIYHTVFL